MKQQPTESDTEPAPPGLTEEDLRIVAVENGAVFMAFTYLAGVLGGWFLARLGSTWLVPSAFVVVSVSLLVWNIRRYVSTGGLFVRKSSWTKRANTGEDASGD